MRNLGTRGYNIVGINSLISNVLTIFSAISFTKVLIIKYLKPNDCRIKTISSIGGKGRWGKVFI